jgi:hypothetical protein
VQAVVVPDEEDFQAAADDAAERFGVGDGYLVPLSLDQIPVPRRGIETKQLAAAKHRNRQAKPHDKRTPLVVT